jgi:hypothetical protein
MIRHILASCSLAAALALPAVSQPTFDAHLEAGRIREARTLVESLLADHPERDELKFQLALTQLLGSVEKFSQTMYRYGLHESVFGEMVPFLRFPVALNPKPEPVTHEAVRGALIELLAGLDVSAKTLAAIPDDSQVKLPFRLGKVKLDLDGDGKVGAQEELWRVFNELNGSRMDEKTASKLGAHLDAGDARWLEGYCRLLGGLGETMLAYDTSVLFDHTAHLFFLQPTTTYPYLQPSRELDRYTISDAIAFIHLLNFPVKEPVRLQTALGYLQQVTALSRRSWKAYLAETDDVYEWIPNPKQKGVLPNGKVTAEMVTAWFQFLDEADGILAGKTLVPFWRPVEAGKGINVRRFFTEPAPLDVVLWLQGPAAARYLETGRVTDTGFWNRLNRVFRGNFLGYAIWFN